MAGIPAGVAERLRPPRSAANGLDRASLVERVRLGLDGQVVVLRAPAGFGKTELMAAAYHYSCTFIERQKSTVQLVATLKLLPCIDQGFASPNPQV